LHVDLGKRQIINPHFTPLWLQQSDYQTRYCRFNCYGRAENGGEKVIDNLSEYD
jgi:hypothetical protein